MYIIIIFYIESNIVHQIYLFTSNTYFPIWIILSMIRVELNTQTTVTYYCQCQ